MTSSLFSFIVDIYILQRRELAYLQDLGGERCYLNFGGLIFGVGVGGGLGLLSRLEHVGVVEIERSKGSVLRIFLLMIKSVQRSEF